MIETTQIEETTYYKAEQRGIAYMIYFNSRGEWEVHSQRKALGRHNVGSYKWFANLDEVEAKYKCFRGLSLLIN